MPHDPREMRFVSPVDLTIEAAAGEDKPALVRVDAYSGGLMTVAGFGPVVLDVEGIESPERVPLLADHENRIEAVLGSGTPTRRDGRLSVEGTLSRTSQRALRVIDLHRDGVPLQASVGAEPLETERIAKGKQVVVNGRTIRAESSSFLLVRRSRLKHVAIVANGADGDTSVNIAAKAATSKEKTDMEFTQWIEPGHEEVIGAFRDFSACESRLLVNRNRLGLNKNTHDALFRAFQIRADVIVHLEDDTVPSPDALRYFDWAVRDLLIPDVKSSDGHQILLASGYNKPKSEPRPEQTHSCATRPIWSPWGWGVDRRRLVWLIANWCTRNQKCFTCQFKQHYRRTRREVFPTLSRIQNIGYDQGENGRSPEWYRANHRTPWVADRTQIGPFMFAGSG